MSPLDADGLGALIDRISSGDLPKEEDLRSVELIEHAIADEFVRRNEPLLRFCHSSKSWFCWDGQIWQRERKEFVFHLAGNLCVELSEREGADRDLKAKLGKASTASAVERFARADPRLTVVAEQWDQDRWLLGTPDGTVDLRTGELREARRQDLITKQTSVAPAPAGTACPIWMAFLGQATKSDAELQSFLQRLAGYALTGDVSEEVMIFLYGGGGNGKGVFLGTILQIMGPYAVTQPIEAFTAGGRNNMEYYRAAMLGARLVTASETEKGATWAESQIKEMTGNEAPLSAREIYGKVFSYWPQFKIVLVGNHAPKLKAKTPAMERRLRIVPFDNKPPRADTGLKVKLHAEASAILRWMIDGCVIWRKDKLGTCTRVKEASAAYLEQQDGFGRWLEECCVLDPDLTMRSGEVYKNYKSWASASGEDAMSVQDFAEEVERAEKLRRIKLKGASYIRGLGLKPPETAKRRDGEKDDAEEGEAYQAEF